MPEQPETWTITITDRTSTKDLESLASRLGGTISYFNPYEKRGALSGRLDLVVEEKTAEERAFLLQRLEHLGLRRVTEEERALLQKGILLPRQEEFFPPPSP